jgi:hypothetical protein
MLDGIVSGAAAPAVGVMMGDEGDAGAKDAGESGLQGVDGADLCCAAVATPSSLQTSKLSWSVCWLRTTSDCLVSVVLGIFVFCTLLCWRGSPSPEQYKSMKKVLHDRLHVHRRVCGAVLQPSWHVHSIRSDDRLALLRVLV